MVGYSPDQATVQVNVTAIQQDTSYKVTYNPAEVKFTIKHYQQNVSNDQYTLVDTETKTGYTESPVGDKLKKSYEGFTALLYDTTTKIAADGSTEVEIYYDRNYYLLTLKLEGGYGADPVYARYGAQISVAVPTKPGYTFGGWSPAIPTTMPAEDKTCTAQWTPEDAVGFTVVFWYENADDEKYSYAGSITAEDAPGTSVASGDYQNSTFEGRDTQHFTYNSAKAETETVAGDGSTVLNVYFTRNTYTLTFKGAGAKQLTCTKTEHTHSSICCKYGGTSITHWTHSKNCCKLGLSEHTHRSQCYKTSDLTITAKYQADIHGNFPINTEDGETILWNVPDGCNSFKPGTYLASINAMPGENITFTKYGEFSAATIYYYVESLAGKTGVYTHAGKQFDLYKKVKYTKSGTLTYAEEFHDITGFTQWWSDPEFSSFDQDGSTSTIKNNNYLCYTRNSYTLKFYNRDAFVESKEATVQYEAPLNGYNFTPDYPAGLEANAYKFAGWYTTSGCYDGSEVNWETMTMPASDVTLYAKWVPMTHTVRTFRTEEVIGDGNQLNIWENVAHRTTIDKPADPTNGNYTFVGWFYRENGVEKAFDFSMPITKDLDLYAKWSSNKLVEYTIKYAVKNADDTLTDIAEETKGSALAGTTKTFDAKTGTALYAGYQSGYFPEVSSHSLTMDIEGNAENKKNEFTFVYVAKSEVEYTVRYLDKATGEPVVVDGVSTPDKTVTTRDAVVTETFKQITGYAPDAYQKRLVLAAEGNEIIFWYTKDTEHAPVQIIHWVQNIKGAGYTEYQSSTDLNAVIDQEQPSAALDIPGFEYVKGTAVADGNTQEFNVPDTPKAVLTAKGLVLNLYYDRIEYPYTFQFLERGTNKVLADPVTGSAWYQAQVTQTAKLIPGYTLVSAENQAINIAIEDPADKAEKNVKIFYYVEQTVEIKYEVIGPVGCGTLDNYQDNTVPVLNGTVKGSTPNAAEGYRFVGWFTDEAGTQPVDSAWVVNDKITPEKTKKLFDVAGIEIKLFEAATYYAKFVKLVGNVTVKKLVTGNLGDKSKDFKFVATYTVNGESKSEQFYLKHDGTWPLQNIPVGTVVTITEDEYSGYTTTNDKGEGGREATITVAEGENSVTFTNNKQAVPDTGVLLDSLPYVVILAVVVLGAALVIVRRRKHRDDD